MSGVSTMRRGLNKSDGFTLLEMVVAMVLTAILFAGIVTTVSLFIRSMQFSNEQAMIMNELDKLFFNIQDEIQKARVSNSLNYVTNSNVFSFEGQTYQIRRDPDNLYRFYKPSYSTNEPYIKVNFKNLTFRYYYYLPGINKEVVVNSGQPSSGVEPGSLRVVEIDGIILTNSGKEIPIRKSFFIDYRLN